MPPLRFDNRFVRELPADPSSEPGRRQVHGALYSRVQPTPVAAPRLVAWSRDCADLLGLAEADVASPAFAQAMAGNALAPGSEPYAANYGGHQFGHWAGQLGDGRAITLGESVNAAGQRLELQLKGAGPTPYSRSADGRAVLRSSVREFLVSEAMHHLGVPTTRALCLVTTGEDVIRDMFYDGRPRAEPGAIVCRVAPSFIRFGNFELPASRGDVALLARLVEFTIRRDFPELVADGQPVDAALRARWFAEVCERTAVMVAHWMRVGFVHGVMNTDNMSILGLTIDYGPYGWIDDFDLDWTPNTTDAEGRRYRFGHNQPVANQRNRARVGRSVEGQDKHRLSENQATVVVVARDVLEPNARDPARHPCARAIGPFDDHDAITVDNVIPAKIREIVWSFQSVEVEMINGCVFALILIHERERRTGHILDDSHTPTDRLRQRRLPGAQVPFECDQRRSPETPTKLLTPSPQLVKRDQGIARKGNWQSRTRSLLRPLAFRLPPLNLPCHLDALIAAKASRFRGVASRLALRSNTSSRSRAAASKSSASAAERISSSNCVIMSSSWAGL